MTTLSELLLATTLGQLTETLRTIYPNDPNSEDEYRMLYKAFRQAKPSFDQYDKKIYVTRLSSGALAAGNLFAGSISDLVGNRVGNRVDNRANADDATLLAVILHDYIVGHDNGTSDFKHAND